MRASAARLGPAGAGQLTKMVNQICIAGLVQGLAEGFSFARAAGLDIEAVVDVISKGAAQCWQMENRHKTMAGGPLRSRLRGGMDAQGSRASAWTKRARNGASLPVTALVDQFYAEVEKMGGKRWDTSSLFARQEDCAAEQEMHEQRAMHRRPRSARRAPIIMAICATACWTRRAPSWKKNRSPR